MNNFLMVSQESGTHRLPLLGLEWYAMLVLLGSGKISARRTPNISEGVARWRNKQTKKSFWECMKEISMKKLLFLALLFSSSVFSAPITFVEMNSIGEYVVPAGYYYYDEKNATIAGGNSYIGNSTYYQNSPSFQIHYNNGTTFGGYLDIDFSSHTMGGPMTVGAYENAERFPFEPVGVSGFDITGNGRGHNTLTGSFNVLDIVYSGDALLRFAATFELNNLVFGRLSYNSEVFSPVPTPASIFLLLPGIAVLIKSAIRRNKQPKYC
jgi:hypothetical protein